MKAWTEETVRKLNSLIDDLITAQTYAIDTRFRLAAAQGVYTAREAIVSFAFDLTRPTKETAP